jgi:hypothetical protein
MNIIIMHSTPCLVAMKRVIFPCLTAYIATVLNCSVTRPTCLVTNVLEGWLIVTSDLMLTTTNAGKSFFFTSHPDVMTINSNINLQGFPQKLSFAVFLLLHLPRASNRCLGPEIAACPMRML